MIRKLDAGRFKFTEFDDSVFKQITKDRHDIVGAKFNKYKILFAIEIVASLVSLFAFSTDVDLTIFSLVLYFGTVLLGVVPLKFLGVIVLHLIS